MKKHLLTATILLSIAIYFIMLNPKAEMTLTYFPIDEEQQFSSTKSSLTPIEQMKTIEWLSESYSDDILYLRQDISLLFTNGHLIGVLNKWAQHVNHIRQNKQLNVKPDTMLTTISFHHGERHHNDQITSIQQMTSDTLYVFKQKAIHTPNTTDEQKKITSLEEKVNKKLTTHGNELMDFYKIERNLYTQIPLTKLQNVRDYFPTSISDESINRIVGQLWEGLYKNYVLPAIEMKATDIMPIILLANDYSHLQVLYTLNGEKMQLIQQINPDMNELTE